MRKPRIIFVNRVYRPSTEATAQLLTDLAEGLAARGWSVHVIAAGRESGPISGVVVHRAGSGEKHGGMFSRVANYVGFLRAARRALSSLVEPDDIVVLMTDPPLLAASATGIALKRGARVVQWIQDIYPEIVTRHVGRWAGWPLLPLKWARNRAWRTASFCLPVGEDMRNTVEAQGVPVAQTAVRPNWAPRELAEIPCDADVAEYRGRQKSLSGFVVGYSGNLGRVHEFDTVLAAAQHLLTSESSSACTFRITGSGPQLAAIGAAKAKSRLENIIIAPPVPRAELALSLAVCDAHLVTLKPGFEVLVNPSKLAGILAAGRAVLFVGPIDSALAGLIRDEKIGAVLAPGDAAGLAATIKRWTLNDGAEARVLGRAARACYHRHFTLDRSLDQWEQLLRTTAPEVK